MVTKTNNQIDLLRDEIIPNGEMIGHEDSRAVITNVTGIIPNGEMIGHEDDT